MANKQTTKEFGIENKRVINELAKTLRGTRLPVGQLVGILEILKTDLILNTGCIIIDGIPSVDIQDKK